MLRVSVGENDTQPVRVAVFGEAAENAANLKKSDGCYIEGVIHLDSWPTNEGSQRHSLSVAAFKCEPTNGAAKKASEAAAPNPELDIPF